MVESDFMLAQQVHSCLASGQCLLNDSLVTLSKSLPQGSSSGTADEPFALPIPGADSLSPWVYLGYYELGKTLLFAQSGGELPQASLPGGEQPAPAKDNLENSLALIRHGIRDPASTGLNIAPVIAGFGDRSIASPPMWSTLLAMLQEGGDFVSDLVSPPEDQIQWFRVKIIEARNLIAQVDPLLDGLMQRLQRLLILALPGPEACSAGQTFGGATAFFFRGASVLNASRRPAIEAMVELLVHEYAHGELFSLAQDQLLCLNSDDERHQVLIRSDPRPMNGILHSLHVMSRVVGVIDKVLNQPPAALPDGGASLQRFRDLRALQQACGLSSLSVIREHARLTPLGVELVAAAAGRLAGHATQPTPPGTTEAS